MTHHSYLANLPESSGRSRFVPVPQSRTGIKPGNGKKEAQPGNVVPDRSRGRSGSISTDSQSQRPVPVPRPVPRRCFLCNSPAHLASACPQKSSGGALRQSLPRDHRWICVIRLAYLCYCLTYWFVDFVWDFDLFLDCILLFVRVVLESSITLLYF